MYVPILYRYTLYTFICIDTNYCKRVLVLIVFNYWVGISKLSIRVLILTNIHTI